MTRNPRIFFILFTVSGFSGLIYESIWTHYLKLFLGHAAYAQSLVLAIFMGGLSLGSWIAGRYSGRWHNLFRGYAIAEGAVGVLALVFHPLFVAIISSSYDSVLPALPSPAAVNAYKWTIATLLILPQSILLGMTFPLMSAALIRIVPDRAGRSLALLYFTNSIGAVGGILASGFLLIKLIGLPGTIVFAGIVNLCIAAAVWHLAADYQPVRSPENESGRGGNQAIGPYRRFLLAASLVTGAASFIYEIGWIRMLSLVLGSSTHAFELMLSAFILGLAFGGLWVHKRIERMGQPVRYLAVVQLVMGLLALATLLVYGNTFSVMRWIVDTMPKTGNGYLLFNLASNILAIAIMVPATFCAGMTLPLITFVLLRKGAGESSIGSVYAMNTIGAIAGVLFSIHVGMPLLGVKGLVIAGAALDMGLGLLLLAWSLKTSGGGKIELAAATAVCLCAAVAVVFLVRFDSFQMASGVYRTGKTLEPGQAEMLFYKDGKTATISVVEHTEKNSTYRSIRTNGKPDAAIGTGIPRSIRPDETTMVVAAALPLAYHPEARTAANIGLGSGLTTHSLLLDASLKAIDTVEIEQEMIEGARLFGQQNHLAYDDPRSRFYIDDAKTFFSSHRKKYDIIVSEPSNPWVSGVAGLFSEEFYRLIGRHLHKDGILVQWVQLYEINMELVATVFKAMSPHFSDYVAYTANYGDLIIIARKEGSLPSISPRIFSQSRMAEKLAQLDFKGIQDIEIRKVGDKKILSAFFGSYRQRANSDYYPVLDQNAAKARFLGENAQDLVRLIGEPLPLVEMLSGRKEPTGAETSVTLSAFHPKTQTVHTAMALRDYLLRRGDRLGPESRAYAEQVEKMFARCGDIHEPNRRSSLFNTAKNAIPYLTPEESAAIWKKLESGKCAAGLTVIEKNYVSLFKAIGARNGRQMAAAAAYLLEHEHDMTPARSKYVVAAGMLGNIAAGDKKEAEKMFYAYRVRAGGEAPIFLHSFLAAQAHAGP